MSELHKVEKPATGNGERKPELSVEENIEREEVPADSVAASSGKLVVGKAVARVVALCSVLVFLAMAAVTFYAFADTSTVSEDENRVLAKEPKLTSESWFSGAYMDEFEDFLSDHLFARNTLIKLAQDFDGLISRPLDIQVAIGENINANTTDVTDVIEVREADSQRYVILDDRVVLTYQHNQPTVDYFATVAKDLFATLPDDVNAYLAVVPSRVAFETDEVTSQSDDSLPDIESIYAAMPRDVTTLDVASALNAHRDEEIFFRTDHYWTQLGAYYCAKELYDAAGVTYLPITRYDKLSGPSFLGYLYASYPSATLKQNPDTLTYYLHNGKIQDETVVETSGTGKFETTRGKVIDISRAGYYAFVARSFSQAIIDGDPSSDKTIMVISDSSMQALAPWLAAEYSKVILIDPRFYEDGRDGIQALMRQYDVTDFLLLQSTLNLPYSTFSTLLKQDGQ